MRWWHGNMAWGHLLPMCFLISTCFLAWRFFWEFLFFSFFSTSSLYLRAESVIFETWRLARILFPHHIGAIFDKHLKSNVSIDSNLWNVMGTIKKRPVLSVVWYQYSFIHSFTSPLCITLVPWEVETTWANTQSMSEYALCISRKHFHSTLCYKHTLTYPITTVHIWHDGVVRIASQLTENNHLAARYCTNSKKSIDSYKLNLQVPWPIETLFRTLQAHISRLPDATPNSASAFPPNNVVFDATRTLLLVWKLSYPALQWWNTQKYIFKRFQKYYFLIFDLFCCSSSVFFL